MSEGQPPEKPTVELEKPPAWAVAMSEKLATGFQSVDKRLDGIETTVDTLVEDGKQANQRMTKIEVRLDEYEKRASTQSLRVKNESQTNMKQDSAIAQVINTQREHGEKIDAIETKVGGIETALAKNNATTDAIKATLSGFLKEHPSIVASIVTLVTTAIGAATAWFAAKGH